MENFMEGVALDYLVTFNDGEKQNIVALFRERESALAYARKQMRSKAVRNGDGYYNVFQMEEGKIRISYVL